MRRLLMMMTVAMVALVTVSPAHASTQHYQSRYVASRLPAYCVDTAGINGNDLPGGGICARFNGSPSTARLSIVDDVSPLNVCAFYSFDKTDWAKAPEDWEPQVRPGSRGGLQLCADNGRGARRR